MVQAVDTIDRRVNELGVAEPNIARHGANDDQILVQLPGVTEVARAKDIIRETAQLEFKLVEAGPAPTREALLQAHNGVVPSDMEVVTGAADGIDRYGGHELFLVRKVAAVTGNDLRRRRRSVSTRTTARRSCSRSSLMARGSSGRSRAATSAGRWRSCSTTGFSRIRGSRAGSPTAGRIAGGFTQQEAADLALKLRSGALPASMSYFEERVVGPTLGRDSIRAGVTASLAGLVARHRLHARLLQAVRHQRHRRDGREPGHPARVMA